VEQNNRICYIVLRPFNKKTSNALLGGEVADKIHFYLFCRVPVTERAGAGHKYGLKV